MNRFTLAMAAAILALVAFGATTVSAQSISAKQATLDEHQDACTDAGGTLTSWHFIINQVRVGSPPANISVTWSNGDVQVVPLSQTSGPVGHYNVAGTAAHTLITSATATIYDAWSGQFNLSSVECEAGDPELDACAQQEGRTVINIDALLGGSFFGLSETSAAIPVNIAAGTYTVTLQSFDDHVAHPGQNQQIERWFGRFATANGPVNTGVISDLPNEPVNTLNEEVGEITFTAAATSLTAVHFLAGMQFLTPESVTATCLALDPVLD